VEGGNMRQIMMMVNKKKERGFFEKEREQYAYGNELGTYQLWYSVFLSQQISISRLISRRNDQPNSSSI
jgi:hypothetical protein